MVSYNTVGLLRRCLGSLQTESAVHEIIVVDNASTDGSPEMVTAEFPTVRLIRNDRNRGFGAANNQGIEAATSEVVLLLNSDCSAEPESITTLASVFEDPSVVAAGGRLYDREGQLQNSCCSSLTLWRVLCEQFFLEKLFPRSKIFNSYWLTPRLANLGPGPHDVEQVMGACLMMRTLERFDESFFLYCEDTDLCKRLRRRGRIVYVNAPFEHALGASTAKNRGWAIGMYNRGKELYFAKHHGPLQLITCWLLNRTGAMLRLLVGIVTFNWVRVANFDRVVFAPLRGPALPPDARKRP